MDIIKEISFIYFKLYQNLIVKKITMQILIGKSDQFIILISKFPFPLFL